MRSPIRTAFRRSVLLLAVVVLIALALPYLMVPLYRFGEPVSTLMLWRKATGQRVERIFVPLGRIAPTLPLTVIISEDGGFCRNRGIDLGAMREALLQADENLDEARGGSTITQQTAKNLFLWQGRSLVRKALEIPLALWMYVRTAEKARARDLPQHRRVGAERCIRRRSRVALGIRQVGARTDAHGNSAELAAVLPNPIHRSARTPSLSVRRLAALHERRAAAYPGLDACVRARAPDAMEGIGTAKPRE